LGGGFFNQDLLDGGHCSAGGRGFSGEEGDSGSSTVLYAQCRPPTAPADLGCKFTNEPQTESGKNIPRN
jgi:hypothetical protein